MDWNDPEQVRAYIVRINSKIETEYEKLNVSTGRQTKKKIRKYMTKYKQDNKEEQQAYHRAYRPKIETELQIYRSTTKK